MTSTHRTIHKSVILVISGVGLQASEWKSVWETKNVNREAVNVDNARKRTIQHLQEKWNTETSGRWTAKLLPDIIRWMERKFEEVNYYMTQLLPEESYLCKYLFRMGKMTRQNCIYCDAGHTFFHCERWRLERRNLEAKVGACTIENFCDAMLSSEEKIGTAWPVTLSPYGSLKNSIWMRV